nr:NADH dehydrogenase subunit 6 [Silo pallipes]
MIMKFHFLLNMFLFMNFWLLNLSHPLIITLSLIFQFCILTLIIGYMSYSFWMSYIMFLVFIGGLLILFIYISSLTPNKMFMFNMKKIIYFMSFFILFIYFSNIYPLLFNMEMMKFMNLYSFINLENKNYISNFYNKNEMYLTILLINYLMLTLIISIKITNLNSGPMRSKF